ncbi:hypothetical protein AURDEDRAFT_69593 [Auricularia subglabra TFB-10046 SS5]|uniref:CoA-dependent acyltransferase n=1 Tax=Auricularia subglabra (strain TFB-10046 / SS5) TaxID=717982 RepID=J0D283_AURST|nr:hypothetical protein AURDEDRAFT_69593 [Auricularia subglabra TFB-10046 SS5]
MPHVTASVNGQTNGSAEHAKSDPRVWERPLGDSELSYFLPSRHEGINDMFVHIGFHAPPALFTLERVSAVWAILRTRHPLLGARIDPRSYDDVRFMYSPPKSPDAAIQSAQDNMEFRIQSKDDLVNTYLNGPRTLSNDRLSYVVVATPQDTPGFPFAVDGPGQEFHFLLAAPHCLGDGMALYRMSDEFFEMLASEKTDEDLKDVLHSEWERATATSPIPEPLEARMPEPAGKLARVFEKFDYVRSQDRLIGGHSFPRPKMKQGPRHIVFPTYSFSPDKSKKVIKTCKSHGVSFSHALFALCNIAWARIQRGQRADLPMMMYSALNLRPYLPPADTASYWFLSIGYFNVVLPSFFPRTVDERKIFWHRALQAKKQTSKYVGSPLLLGRSRQMGLERAKRAKVWAKEDDDAAAFGGLGNAAAQPKAAAAPATSAASAPAPKKPPSVALVGLSLLGDLDRVFHHDRYPSVRLHALTPGSRVRGGGTLLFGYTFAGKLWLNLPWDANGFDRAAIEAFWEGLVRGVDEFLVE